MLTRPLLALLLMWSCNPEPPPEPSLSIGTGESQYEAFEDGQTLNIVAGCQGLQHIWMGLRAEGIDPRGTIIDVSIQRARDRLVVSQSFRLRLSMRPVDGSDVQYELYGLTVVVPNPAELQGEDLLVTAIVTDRDGVEVTATKPLRATPGPGGCDM